MFDITLVSDADIYQEIFDVTLVCEDYDGYIPAKVKSIAMAVGPLGFESL